MASQWPESDKLPETPTIRARTPEKLPRIDEESLPTNHSTNFTTRNETGRKPTAITRLRSTPTTSPSVASNDDESARPPKRPRLPRRVRRRTEDESDYGHRLAAALNTASNANQNPPTKMKRRGRVQADVDDRSPRRDHERPTQEECPQPSLPAESKEEYERKIHELEERLARVEAQNQPKQIADQVLDAFVHRAKDVRATLRLRCQTLT